MLQAQCWKWEQRVKKPFSDSVVRVCRLGKHSLTIFGHFGQTRIVDVLMVASVHRARLLGIIRKPKAQNLRQCLSVGSVLGVEGAADDEPPDLVQALALSGSGVSAPATDGQVGGLRHWGVPKNVAFPLQVWRRDATTVTVFMLDGAVSGHLMELTTWDKFGWGLVRWRFMVVLDSFGCWDLSAQRASNSDIGVGGIPGAR